VYFTYERQVLDAVTAYLTDRGVRVFTEHDGFTTDRELDTVCLAAHVKARTGFEVTIECS
jgi:hypothetical protein